MSTKRKTAAFIDGSNIFATMKAINLNLDYNKLLTWLKQETDLVSAYYYTAIDDRPDNDVKKLVDYLSYNGYLLRTKPVKSWTDAITNERKIKGNMDLEMCVDMIKMADRIDQVYLFTGDGDFKSVVEYLQSKAITVVVVSTITSKPAMIADELRRTCDKFIDLHDLRSNLDRNSPKLKTLTLRSLGETGRR